MIKREIKRFKSQIEKINLKKERVKIKLINHPHLVYYWLPLHFFDKIGLPIERFWLIVFEDESILLEEMVIPNDKIKHNNTLLAS